MFPYLVDPLLGTDMLLTHLNDIGSVVSSFVYGSTAILNSTQKLTLTSILISFTVLMCLRMVRMVRMMRIVRIVRIGRIGRRKG